MARRAAIAPTGDEGEDARLLLSSGAGADSASDLGGLELSPLARRPWRVAAAAAAAGLAMAGAATAAALTAAGGASSGAVKASADGAVGLTVAGAAPDSPAAGEGWVGHSFSWFENPWWCQVVGTRGDWEYKRFEKDSPCGAFECCKRRLANPLPDLLERAAKTPTHPPSAPNVTAAVEPPTHSGAAAAPEDSQEGEWRRGSFIVIGDWGYDAVTHAGNQRPGCEGRIAEKMHEVMNTLGDTKFVINVGDSFYPSGVANKGDPQWQNKWRNVFPPKTRSVPWYSIYGNHDLHIDPCVCNDDLSKCAQINADEGNLDFFVMPNYTYYKEMQDLDLEIIGLDFNHFMQGWDHNKKKDQLSFSDCEWTPCKATCPARFEARSEASFRLFRERMANSKAKNLLVFSHYPTDYFAGGAPEFLDELKDNSSHDIVYFGGHRHSTDQWSTWGIHPNQNWLVGGGGGWGCDTDTQGFVVGEIMQDYSIRTFRVLLDVQDCCIAPATTTAPPAGGATVFK